ncbi:MAG: SDR family NAD(P)-dependent oxidoreductase [Magnetococcales bacterium]|nr:SDR family NAD(P)-dependent oxidoreductase [Magnetococcales bacterium]
MPIEPDGRENRHGMKNVWNGFKVALALILGWPFIAVLLPMWLIYSWNEHRLGRPVPHAPWSLLMQAFRKSRKTTARSASVKRAEILLDDFAEEDSGHSLATAYPKASTPERLPSWAMAEEPPSGGVALVTGGGRRLGAAICRDLARIGFDVGVVYHRDLEPARNLVDEIVRSGGVAYPFRLDWHDPTSAETLLEEATQALGGVPRLLVNNASRFQPTGIEGTSWEELETLFRVNLQGPMWLSWCAARRMIGHGGGQIVNICDIWGERPLAGYAAYGASKAGLIMATQVMARDLAPDVRVNAIAPGAILPPEINDGPEAEAFQRLLSRTPLARQAGPEAVIRALHYLLTAPYVTGEILRVDGGRSLS